MNIKQEELEKIIKEFNKTGIVNKEDFAKILSTLVNISESIVQSKRLIQDLQTFIAALTAKYGKKEGLSVTRREILSLKKNQKLYIACNKNPITFEIKEE